MLCCSCLIVVVGWVRVRLHFSAYRAPCPLHLQAVWERETVLQTALCCVLTRAVGTRTRLIWWGLNPQHFHPLQRELQRRCDWSNILFNLHHQMTAAGHIVDSILYIKFVCYFFFVIFPSKTWLTNILSYRTHKSWYPVWYLALQTARLPPHEGQLVNAGLSCVLRNVPERDRRGGGGPQFWTLGGISPHGADGLPSVGHPQWGETLGRVERHDGLHVILVKAP